MSVSHSRYDRLRAVLWGEVAEHHNGHATCKLCNVTAKDDVDPFPHEKDCPCSDDWLADLKRVGIAIDTAKRDKWLKALESRGWLAAIERGLTDDTLNLFVELPESQVQELTFLLKRLQSEWARSRRKRRK